MKKNLLCAVLMSAYLFLFGVQRSQAADLTIDSQAAIAYEYHSGQVLYEHNSQAKLPVASLSKLLTIYLTLSEIKSGRLQWDTQIPLSDYAKELNQNLDISNPHMSNNSYSAKELIESTLIVSANSSAVALAEYIAGSEPRFVNQMLKQVQAWGIRDATIVNATGLNNSMLGRHIYPGSKPDEENAFSARDLALITQHLLHDFPEINTITAQPFLKWENEQMANSNLLLPGQTFALQGVDGLKTGTTAKAGQSLLATASHNGMRFVLILLHAGEANKADDKRFVEAKKALTYLYDHYQATVITPASPILPQTWPVSGGTKSKLAIYTRGKLTIIHPKNQPLARQHIKVKLSHAQAPITKQQKLGHMSYQVDSFSPSLAYLDKQPDLSIYAKEDLPRQGFWSSIKNWLKTSLFINK
ncbi:serine hydrolase [Streptococcus halichoeri]|uniref:serine hydrolase n=1 Tax=Streptococcus halichoeri TaxID=254785 RepID=UPI0013599DC7|nr:serine hydrolase [Streptococcus halichoeri]